MRVPTGYASEGATATEQAAIIGAARIDKTHPRFEPLTLRDALNMIAHYRSADATFQSTAFLIARPQGVRQQTTSDRPSRGNVPD
jgi:hypothetical protein